MNLLKSIDEVAYQALHEDLGDGDLTANLIPEDLQLKARLITREDASQNNSTSERCHHETSHPCRYLKGGV